MNLTIQMELMHWNQDRWDVIPSKNHVREGCPRFSDKQLIYSTWPVREACVPATSSVIRTMQHGAQRGPVTLAFSSYL